MGRSLLPTSVSVLEAPVLLLPTGDRVAVAPVPDPFRLVVLKLTSGTELFPLEIAERILLATRSPLDSTREAGISISPRYFRLTSSCETISSAVPLQRIRPSLTT